MAKEKYQVHLKAEECRKLIEIVSNRRNKYEASLLETNTIKQKGKAGH
jgi:hypothetical protein